MVTHTQRLFTPQMKLKLNDLCKVHVAKFFNSQADSHLY